MSPLDQGANSRIAAALTRIARGYTNAASAARADDTSGYNAAGREITRGGTALSRAFDQLKALGYSLES